VADALQLAHDGDSIEVLPGTYAGDVAVIPHRRLTIRGLGAGAVMQARGRHAEGKAIWVIRDGEIAIENIHFKGTRVPDGNGAGIRLEHGRLHLSRCSFSDNQMGLVTANDGRSELFIDGCQFSEAPVPEGALPHLLYVGRIARLELRNSVLRQGREGHLLKCRAAQSLIIGNRLDDGLTGEASYEIDLPNGGAALLEGNTVVQSARSQNPVMLAYGAEQPAWPDCRLTLRGNTFINHRTSGGWFVRVWREHLPDTTTVQSQGNRWLGPGSLGWGAPVQGTGDERGPAPRAAPSATD
jgi:hypothetical protein